MIVPPTTRRARSPARAFTAVEMLIVIFIVTLLAAFIVVAVRGLHRRAQVAGTEAMMAQLEAACQRYWTAWDNRYPPHDFAGLGLSEPAAHAALDAETLATVVGAECLLLALGSPQMGGPFFEIKGGQYWKQLCDLDRDGLENDARFTYWEVADAWGNPIRYENLGDTVGVRFWSAGPDARFGTDDDLANR